MLKGGAMLKNLFVLLLVGLVFVPWTGHATSLIRQPLQLKSPLVLLAGDKTPPVDDSQAENVTAPEFSPEEALLLIKKERDKTALRVSLTALTAGAHTALSFVGSVTVGVLSAGNLFSRGAKEVEESEDPSLGDSLDEFAMFSFLFGTVAAVATLIVLQALQPLTTQLVHKSLREPQLVPGPSNLATVGSITTGGLQCAVPLLALVPAAGVVLVPVGSLGLCASQTAVLEKSYHNALNKYEALLLSQKTGSGAASSETVDTRSEGQKF
ncbi:MAG: hypothetical protein CMH56_04840 [Myxococcales bacterium]|nr:hypothetical protein [Myxococcales bacterium]